MGAEVFSRVVPEDSPRRWPLSEDLKEVNGAVTCKGPGAEAGLGC